MATGDNLFQTLALNLLPYNADGPVPSGADDCPAWEDDRVRFPQREGSAVRGYLDYLTWQSRRIQLLRDGESTRVARCRILQGLKMASPEPRDPFKAYMVKDDGPNRELVPVPLSPGRALWRDSHVLVQEIADRRWRPELMNHLARFQRIRQRRGLSGQSAFPLMLVGLATEPGKAGSVVMWRHERLVLPLRYAEDDTLAMELEAGLQFAEDVGRLLGSRPVRIPGQDGKRMPSPMQRLAEQLLPKDARGRVDRGAAADLIRSLDAASQYWCGLETSFFRFLQQLAVAEDSSALASVKHGWAGAVGLAVQDALNSALAEYERSGAKELHAATNARNLFAYMLREYTEEYSGKEDQ